jgi:Dyp-type peroxidase family
MTASRTAELELEKIQGNVLQGYRFPCAAYVNLRVGNPQEGRRLLRDLRVEVTDAQDWGPDKPPATLNVALSHAGLRALGVSDDVLDTFPQEFSQGMAARAERLGDVARSAPDGWEGALRPGLIHLLVIVHARSDERIDVQIDRLYERVGARRNVHVVDVQRAGLLGSDNDSSREHFGYRDGFGQPAIEGVLGHQDPGQGVQLSRRRWRSLKPGEFVLGYHDEDGVLPAAPVPPFNRNGTFMVYRKIAQDVAAFRRLLTDLAREHFSGDDEFAAAKLAGRWRDGVPIMLRPEDAGAGYAREELNAFRYADDPQGRVCPIGAHIRRANPRDSLYNGDKRTSRHRIIRRGMPYGKTLGHGAVDRTAGRGLIFVCFNASIARQFEVVNAWLNNGDVFGLGRDADVLTGSRCVGPAKMTVQGDPPVLLSPKPLVWTRGGEYLFLPSVDALDALADGGGRL